MELQRGFTRRFRTGSSVRDNPILEAIFDDNLAQFKTLLESDSAAVTNAMFLYYIIKLDRMELFRHLLTLPNFDPDCPDDVGRNMLMGIASVPRNEPFALALLEKGSNVRWRDGSGFTYLHMAARAVDVDNSAVGSAVIERGADVNAETNRGETPLYVACEEGNYSFCCLLLFYGADATIATHKGVLPVVATGRWVPRDQQPRLQELLFDYTFDSGEAVVSLTTLVEAMVCDTPLFTNIVENVADVIYGVEDLQHFCDSLRYLRPHNLRLFVSRFGDIVRELIDHGRLLINVVEVGWVCDGLVVKAILDVFMESDCLFQEMVQASDPTYPTLACLVDVFNQSHVVLDREEVTKMACVMLTFGLGVTSTDLDVVYKYYGHCELFRILLHMDIHMLRKDGATVASLYYDLDADVEDVLDDARAVDLLSFFSNPKLKEICLRCEKEEIAARAKDLPQVPSLVELSRNVARKFIVRRYKIKNSRQFYTILKWLPIGDINKKILALERKLYCWM